MWAFDGSCSSGHAATAAAVGVDAGGIDDGRVTRDRGAIRGADPPFGVFARRGEVGAPNFRRRAATEVGAANAHNDHDHSSREN